MRKRKREMIWIVFEIFSSKSITVMRHRESFLLKASCSCLPLFFVTIEMCSTISTIRIFLYGLFLCELLCENTEFI